jgi:hypothetical protein
MKRLTISILILIAILFAGCSSIPKDYNPPQYRQIAVFGTYVMPVNYNIGSKEDLKDAITEGIVEALADVIAGDYPEWRTTSELARVCSRCGYDVYLVAPNKYFEQRKDKVDVAHQKRFEGWTKDDYFGYIGQMKSMVLKTMEPTAYIICRQTEAKQKEDSYTVEMRRWKNDRLIFSMSYSYFMKNYGEFFCGADVGEPDETPREEHIIIDGKSGKDSADNNSDPGGKGSRIE